MGMLLRTFSTREREPMIRMFNSYIKSKLEYCSIVWSPIEQKGINDIENIQRTFTKKIEGMEELNYHQRLKELKMYSMERRRERYVIIYGWQQLEGIKENVLKLKTSGRSGTRRIQLGDEKYSGNGGLRILPSVKTRILNSPARQTERLFNRVFLRETAKTGKGKIR